MTIIYIISLINLFVAAASNLREVISNYDEIAGCFLEESVLFPQCLNDALEGSDEQKEKYKEVLTYLMIRRKHSLNFHYS